MLSIVFDRLLPFAHQFPLLLLAAKKTAAAAVESTGKSLSMSWAIVLFCIILGCMVSLNPSRRTTEIKRPTE